MFCVQKKLQVFSEDHNQQQPFDSICVSSQIKQMNTMLDETLTSQKNTTKIVKQLSVAIEEMQDNMSNMQQLLNLAIENQEVVRQTCVLRCNDCNMGMCTC